MLVVTKTKITLTALIAWAAGVGSAQLISPSEMPIRKAIVECVEKQCVNADDVRVCVGAIAPSCISAHQMRPCTTQASLTCGQDEACRKALRKECRTAYAKTLAEVSSLE